MKRALALAAAVAMVAVAVLVRDRLGDGGGGSAAAGPTPTVACLPELAEVCAALAADGAAEVVVEGGADTAARLAAADLDPSSARIDGWLTFAPLAEVVEGDRARRALPPALGQPSPTLARSPLVAAGWGDRVAVLAGACGGEVTWRCLGERSGVPWATVGGDPLWGAVEPAHARPDRSATGLLALAWAAASWFGSGSYAANDFDDPAFRAWFEQLERGIPSFPNPPRTPLDDMLSLGRASFDVAADLEAVAGPEVAASRANAELAILYPSPTAVAEVVMVPIAGSPSGGEVLQLSTAPSVADALAAHGWRVPGHRAHPALPADLALPDGDGLPPAGVLEALRARWAEVAR